LVSGAGAPAIRSLAVTEIPVGRIGVLGADDGRVSIVDLVPAVLLAVISWISCHAWVGDGFASR
jgi:hypothetical protein